MKKVVTPTLMSSGIFFERAWSLRYNGCNANTDRELHNKENVYSKIVNSTRYSNVL